MSNWAPQRKDQSPTATERSIGTGQHQASSGSHTHDGTTSKKIGAGKVLDFNGNTNSTVQFDMLLSFLQDVLGFEVKP